MHLIQYARMLWARRSIILIMTLAGLILGTLMAKSLPKVYEAKSRLMLDVLTPDPVTGDSINSRSAGTYFNTQAELIRDYRTMGKVVDMFGWTSSPELAAQYAGRPSDDHRDFRRWLAQRVIDATQVNMVQGSNVLEITYSSSSPDVSRRAADAIRQAYVDQAIGFKRETAGRNAQWFDRETDRLKGELAVAEKKAAEFEKANGIILQDDTTDTETAKLRALAASAPVGPTSSGPSMPISVPSQAQVAQIDTQIAIAAEQLGPNHPTLVAMRRQRAAAEQAVQREMAAARASMGGSSGPSIESAINAQTQKVLAKRGLIGEAQRLAANVSILRSQYQKTAARAADLKQQAMSTESGLTLLGNAVAPEDPVSPNIPAIIFGGLGAGLGLGLALSFAIELFQRRVRGVEDLMFDGVPVIGAMIKDASTAAPRNFWYWLGFSQAPWKRAVQ